MNIEELKLKYQEHKQEIKAKLKEFSELNKEEYINELFFCLLTPQSKAEKCWQAVQELKNCKLEHENIKSCLKSKTRFHNNKTKYIVQAKEKWDNIKELIHSNNPLEIREFLVNNVKGLGMKEASHFLRNIGKSQNELAILDRHILRKLQDLGIIEKEIKLDKKGYLEIEKKMLKFSQELGIPLDELDLLFFKVESGRIFK